MLKISWFFGVNAISQMPIYGACMIGTLDPKKVAQSSALEFFCQKAKNAKRASMRIAPNATHTKGNRNSKKVGLEKGL